MKIVATTLSRGDAMREAEARVRLDAIVVVTRPDERFEVRLVPDRVDARGYRVSVRRWLVETRQVQGRRPFEFKRWSDWAACCDWDEAFRHFCADAATADDWYVQHVVYVTFDEPAATNDEHST